MQAGEYIKAHDEAVQALKWAPGDIELRRRAVLALAETGATELAIQLWTRFDRDGHDGVDDRLLWARLLKDRAFGRHASERGPYLERAVAAYRAAHDKHPESRSARNVAALSALLGQHDDAALWANRVLHHVGPDNTLGAERARAEALLILGRLAEAERAVEHAADLAKGDLGERANATRQLRHLCAAVGAPQSIVRALQPPAVMHYCGIWIAPLVGEPAFPVEHQTSLRRRIDDWLARTDVGIAVGGLAAGAEIVVAEALIEAGIELDVVLPFDVEAYVAAAVAPAGGTWVERFYHCFHRADDRLSAAKDTFFGEGELFAYASELAIGVAQVRAQWLESTARQVAVGDWTGSGGGPGVDYALSIGRRLGLEQDLLPPDPDTDARTPAELGEHASLRPGGRLCRVMLFGDLDGFSHLSDRQLPAYVEHVLGELSEVCRGFGNAVKLANTWGDGLFLVFDDVHTAADCAFALQRRMRTLDLAGHGLPETLGLRLAFHYGPVYEARDPLLGRSNYFGQHVSRAARVEPITPEGEVYVTEPTAAALAVACPGCYQCDYVGQQQLPKNDGRHRMYQLRRSS